jgi:hypothetical protein
MVFFKRISNSLVNPAQFKDLIDDSIKVSHRMNAIEAHDELSIDLIATYQVIEGILIRPSGHLLLPGSSGSGRRTGVKRVSFALKYRTITAPIVADLRAFIKFIKQTLAIAVEENCVTVILFETGVLTSEQLSVISALIGGDCGSVWKTAEELGGFSGLVDNHVSRPLTAY